MQEELQQYQQPTRLQNLSAQRQANLSQQQQFQQFQQFQAMQLQQQQQQQRGGEATHQVQP
jgi:hypothetical protein